MLDIYIHVAYMYMLEAIGRVSVCMFCGGIKDF